jgi:hypothetical protein
MWMSRLNSEAQGRSFPEKWTENAVRSFDEFFTEHHPEQLKERTFHCWCYVYSNELLLTLSLSHIKNEISPLTLMLSMDLDESLLDSDQKIRSLLNGMTEFAGEFFQEQLITTERLEVEQEEDSIYYPEWQSYNYKKIDLHYKVTRENIELSFIADELLKANNRADQ